MSINQQVSRYTNISYLILKSTDTGLVFYQLVDIQFLRRRHSYAMPAPSIGYGYKRKLVQGLLQFVCSLRKVLNMDMTILAPSMISLFSET